MSSYAAFRADSARIESSSCATRYCSDIFYKAWRIRDTLGRRGGGAAFRRAVACRNMAAVGRAHRCVMLLWVMALGNARRWVSGQRGRAKYPGVTFRVSSGVHRARAHIRVESTQGAPRFFAHALGSSHRLLRTLDAIHLCVRHRFSLPSSQTSKNALERVEIAEIDLQLAAPSPAHLDLHVRRQ